MDVDEYEGAEEVQFDEPEKETQEEFECDFSAYVLFHEGKTGAPCLSFDIIEDDLGDNRNFDTPLTCYFVSGSQAAQTHQNNIVLLKMRNLLKIKQDEDKNEDEEDEEEEENAPIITSALAPHDGCVNRIRATTVNTTPLAATWSESGEVHIWDLSPMLLAVNDRDAMLHYQNTEPPSPVFTFRGHREEGFALDWSAMMPGTLATGDCFKNIFVWKPNEGSWAVGSEPYCGHNASVEDIQWSPTEEHVFASCSVDKSIRVWDARAPPKRACMLACEHAHDKDVNVIHWNRNEPFIASGGDDAVVKVWDLRKFETKQPVALFQYHNGPVCTVEWHPSDSSVLASGGEDDCVLQWDLAVEKDEGEGEKEEEGGEGSEEQKEETPQQLLFVHQGQKEVKEIHWHPQVPGLMISTAHSGFNIFKTVSC